MRKKGVLTEFIGKNLVQLQTTSLGASHSGTALLRSQADGCVTIKTIKAYSKNSRQDIVVLAGNDAAHSASAIVMVHQQNLIEVQSLIRYRQFSNCKVIQLSARYYPQH
ncbi:hypothetical protein NIES2107_72400 (plasmid) [Nostoc carneum NIES-2107]|nr:hypothetical protein NIES2107_72400 [Nostoc carneum NIES-2107]